LTVRGPSGRFNTADRASRYLADGSTLASRSRFGACLRSADAGTLCPFFVELLGLQAVTRHFRDELQGSPRGAN